MSRLAPSHRNEGSRAWSEELVDELARQLATHPDFEALVQARVQQALAQHETRDRVWLTLKEAAERLGCSPDAVRMRVNRGRLDHRRQGRRLYVSAVSVERLGRAA
jgi:excisionase family DNA binding protein